MTTIYDPNAMTPLERLTLQVEILRACAAVARPMIRERWNADSCIASTAIGIKALERIGITARAAGARVYVYNRQAVGYIERHGMPQNDQELRAMQRAGGWTVGIGLGVGGDMRPKRFHGPHVVIKTMPGILVDLSIDQVNRPQHGIHVGPIVVPVTPPEWAGERRLMTTNDTGDVLLAYEFVELTGHETTPDWNHPELDQMAERIVRQGFVDRLLNDFPQIRAGLTSKKG